MPSFWELFKSSSILQAFLTLIVWSTVCYLYAQGQPIPEPLLSAALLILGFYFGVKLQQTVTRVEALGVRSDDIH